MAALSLTGVSVTDGGKVRSWLLAGWLVKEAAVRPGAVGGGGGATMRPPILPLLSFRK